MNLLESETPNFFYKTGLDIDGAYLLYNEKYEYLLINEMNKEFAKKQFKGKIIITNNIIKELKKRNIKILGLDLKNMKANSYLKLKKYFKIKDISEELEKKRIRKTKKEIKNIKKAIRITKEIIEEIEPFGKKEIEVEKEIKIKAIKRGVEPEFIIVASGKNTRYPHYKARNIRIKDPVLIDFGVRYKGYVSDITRMKIKDNKYKKAYEKVKNIFYEIIDKQWETAGELAKYVENKKLKMPHLIGHGIGIEVHERPYLYALNKERLKGSVLAIEPAEYYSNFGVRYEDDVIVGKKLKLIYK